MGSFQTKDKSYPNDKVVQGLKYKVRFLQAEVNEIMCMREHESQAYAQESVIFALKEAEWKIEKKKLKEEVKKLKKKLEDKEEDEEEKFKRVEDHEVLKGDMDWHKLGTSYLLEQIKEEQARRDEAIDKWKQLYFAIKIELDDLIQRTNQGEAFCWKTEQMELLEDLHRELKEKEETIAFLKERATSMEQQELKKEREVDILRQSLKIISYNMNTTSMSKNLSKSLHM